MCHWCLHLCHISFISLSYFCLGEHNQLVLPQIKSAASLWPIICPHPLGNTLRLVSHTRAHTYMHDHIHKNRNVEFYILIGAGRKVMKWLLPLASSSSSSTSFLLYIYFLSVSFISPLFLIPKCCDYLCLCVSDYSINNNKGYRERGKKSRLPFSQTHTHKRRLTATPLCKYIQAK